MYCFPYTYHICINLITNVLYHETSVQIYQLVPFEYSKSCRFHPRELSLLPALKPIQRHHETCKSAIAATNLRKIAACACRRYQKLPTNSVMPPVPRIGSGCRKGGRGERWPFVFSFSSVHVFPTNYRQNFFSSDFVLSHYSFAPEVNNRE